MTTASVTTSRWEVLRERFGGVDTPAAIAGMFTAMGVFLFLAGLGAAGVGGLAFQVDTVDVEGAVEEISLIGGILALVGLFMAFLVGGWAAGRMARYDGGLNGAMTAFWMVLLIVIFAALGAWIGEEYNVFAQMNLPDWVAVWSSDEATAAAVIGGVLGIVVMFLGGYVGGQWGEAYHRKADAALADAARNEPPPVI
jgi:hypothetical protein